MENDTIEVSDVFNITSSIQRDWTWDRTLISIILGTIVICTILGNFLVLFVFVTRPRDLRSPSQIFIANLALADFLVAVLCLPFTATLQVTGNWYFGQVGCLLWTIGHWWFCSASILSTCAVCIERYIGVRYPLKHMEILNPKRLKWMIATVWLLAGTLTLTSTFAWPDHVCKDDEHFVCKVNNQLVHAIIMTVGMLYVPAIVMIILYWRIYVIAKSHLNALRKPRNKKKAVKFSQGRVGILQQEEASTEYNVTFQTDLHSIDLDSAGYKLPSSLPNALKKQTVMTAKSSASKKQIDLARRLAVLVGIVVISYFPYFTVFLIRTVNPSSISVHVYNTFKWFRYLNSCLNPILYAYAMPGYSKAIHNVFIQVRNRSCF